MKNASKQYRTYTMLYLDTTELHARCSLFFTFVTICFILCKETMKFLTIIYKMGKLEKCNKNKINKI